MSNPTTPFSWQMPTATDLVTDLPADFEVFGQAVASSMADLLGGTTGQVLSKTTNADMDFTWVTTDDANAIQNSIVDAKGDLIAATANDTPARLAVGNNGESLIVDSSQATGLRYQGSQAAAKNYIINGAMDFWQRSTSSASLGYVTADRWYINNASGTTTSSQETSIVPTGIARYALKLTQSVASAQVVAQQPLESQLAIPLAGQTIIVSAYVAASASTNFTIDLGQSTSTDVAATGSWTFTSGTTQNVATTSYVRVSQTFTVSGTSKSLMPRISMTSLGSGNSFYISGVQMEISAVPTQFTRAGGTIQGELAACQRYFQKSYPQGTAPATNSTTGGINFTPNISIATANTYLGFVKFPVVMRSAASVTIYSFTSSTISVVSNASGTDLAASSGVGGLLGDSGFTVQNTSGGTITGGSGGFIFHHTASAEL